MAKKKITQIVIALLLISAAASLATYSQAPAPAKTNSDSLTVPGEKHLKNVRQLTFGGTNAEAYFSGDNKSLIFMHSGEGVRATRCTPCPSIRRTARPPCQNL